MGLGGLDLCIVAVDQFIQFTIDFTFKILLFHLLGKLSFLEWFNCPGYAISKHKLQFSNEILGFTKFQ
jgi:hypothetical protein